MEEGYDSFKIHTIPHATLLWRLLHLSLKRIKEKNSVLDFLLAMEG